MTRDPADLQKTLVDQSRAPGEVFVESFGDYELLDKLGEGGMGAVWRARQRSLDRMVAIKLIASAKLDAAAVQRFVREARTAARINHPNVVRVFDAGSLPDGRVYMSLELVTGGDARQLAERAPGQRLPEPRALAIVRDACRGLVALSGVGLVHRDIKPANIFLADDGQAKLADLGLARQAQGDDRITTTGLVIGTPAFMAPEQAEAGAVDVRTDIYSLGATLFALLCGRPPFEGNSGMVVLCKAMKDPAPDPRTIVSTISAKTARLLERALAKTQAERFQTADELLAALEDALLRPSGTSGALRKPSGRLERRPASVRTTRVEPAPRGRGGLVIAISCGVAALAIGAGAMFANTRDDPPVPVASAAAPNVAAVKPAPPATERPVEPASEAIDIGVEDAPVPPPLLPVVEPPPPPPIEEQPAPLPPVVEPPTEVAPEPAAPEPEPVPEVVTPPAEEEEPVVTPADESARRRPARRGRPTYVAVAPTAQHVFRPAVDQVRAVADDWVEFVGNGLTLGFREPRQIDAARFQLALAPSEDHVMWLCLVRALDASGQPGADVRSADHITGTPALAIFVGLDATKRSLGRVCLFPADRKLPAEGLEGSIPLASFDVQLGRDRRVELTCERGDDDRWTVMLKEGRKALWQERLAPRPELAGPTTFHTFVFAYAPIRARQRVEVASR